MFKRVLFVMALLVGIGNAVHAGDYAVGTKFVYTAFSAQPKYGVRGYFVLEPNGLPHSASYPIYHTTTNHSRYGSETIVVYGGNGSIDLKIVTWIPNDRGCYDNLTQSPLNPSYYVWYKTLHIGNSNGNIDSTFQKYTTTATLEGESKKVILVENVSDWNSGVGKWREITRLYNYDTNSWDTLLDVVWNGNMQDNYSSLATEGVWAGALETFEGTLPAWNGKKAGNYSMLFIGANGLWVSMQSPWCSLQESHSKTGLQVVNSNPIPSYWLATVP